jgi:hypothetical protein
MGGDGVVGTGGVIASGGIIGTGAGGGSLEEGSVGTGGKSDIDAGTGGNDGASGLDAGDSSSDASTQHPYVSPDANCINYPVDGYRVFPYDPSIGGGKRWPTCTLNCATVMPIWGAAGAPLDQTLPAGPCDDEGATCDSPVMTGWCSPCADVGGPGNGYTCVCRGHNWHCALIGLGANLCGPPTCVDPSLTPYTSCYQTTWNATQICACDVCRDLCTSDAECPSGRCNLNQVCRAPTSCAGPDECPASCTGLCAPVTFDGGTADADGP